MTTQDMIRMAIGMTKESLASMTPAQRKTFRLGGVGRPEHPWDQIHLSKVERKGKTPQAIQAMRRQKWEILCKKRIEAGEQPENEILAVKLY